MMDAARTAAVLFAVDPAGTGGVAVTARPGPARDAWIALLRGLLPPQAPVRRIPLHVTDDRLLGGLDLAATLRAGRPVAQRGLLAEADGGVVLLAMAERVSASTAARLAAVLDAGVVEVEREGVALRAPARLGAVAFDESLAEGDERPPAALLDRLAFRVVLDGLRVADLDGVNGGGARFEAATVAAARARLPSVRVERDIAEALCAAAMALGVPSLRAPFLALRVARAAAALDARRTVSADDAALAAQLVLAPRATAAPPEVAAEDADERRAEEEPPPVTGDSDGDGGDERDEGRAPVGDVVLAAAQAAIPDGLLARLRPGAAAPNRIQSAAAGRSGAHQQAGLRHGRPAGARPGPLRAGARLNLVATLRAAAPWQSLRQRGEGDREGAAARIEVRRDDFHIARLKRRAKTTAIFAVDASGSAALHRLAEAKGAVELLLADCYVRRDRVALLAFRGAGAALLLPPTSSLVRARRSLAELPGGGGTPLASGIDAAVALAGTIRRAGGTPLVALLTDGRANIARDGAAGRARAGEEALAAARALRAAGVASLLVDTSPRPALVAQRLATEMGARYLPLPYADAAAVSRAVRAAAGPAFPGHAPGHAHA